MYRNLIHVLSAARLISRPQGATIADLMDKIGLSRRSVYRLIDALQELDYPLYDEEETGQERVIKLNEARDRLRWWLPLPTVRFDFQDRVLLDFLFQEAAATPALAEPVRILRQKLAGLAADGGISIAGKDGGAGTELRLAPHMLKAAPVGKLMGKEDATHFQTLLQGYREKAVCIVSYEAMGSGAVKTYRIHPLALFEHSGGLYVYVLVPYYGNIRILSVERIRSVELTEEGFEAPASFHAEKLLADPFGIVLADPFTARICFDADQAPYIKERAWPEGTSFEELDDGSVVLVVETGGAYELKRWVQGYGASAEILEPAWLRDGMAEELASAAERYRK
jgi:predicted DNA-binding transcriptional regulator YafY